MTNQEQLTKKEKRQLKREEKIQKREQHKKNKNRRKIFVWSATILVIGVIIVGMIALVLQGNNSGNEEGVKPSEVTADDWIKGIENSDLTLIEYSDFQCPACASYQPMIEKLLEEFGDKITFVYRHFPLKQIHSNATLAAQAAEAAGRQGKFWEMHDLLFDRQKSWADSKNAKDIFINYAKELELDENKFKDDITSKEIKNRVEDDFDEANRIRLNATPTFFLNGEKIKTPRNYEDFKKIIPQSLRSDS